ncbi:MAG: serine/threonine-protein kinase [Terriglobales bacterium]
MKTKSQNSEPLKPQKPRTDDRGRERFGRYEILAELGRGAMGVVYKARDPKINRVVAVKTISLAGQPAEDELEYRERFIREAEAAGRLSHPGIVTIFDVGEEPETRSPYIVMEFVGGQSLDNLLSQQDHKLPVESALQLTLELAEALDCAHGQGVVHRDLKPANILLTDDGHAKIADFGIAKLNLANQTLVGRTLGTPAYMSPEQLNGDDVDGRSDLFSLGVILYTMLTGHRPFQGNSALTVSFKVVNRDPIPATLLDTELPPGLDYIISRAIAKDPALRYQRGLEMVLDIQHLQQGREPWSKAKQPLSTSNGEGDQTEQELARASALGYKAIRSSTRAVAADNDKPADLREHIRKASLAGAIVLAGLFILGFWIISFDPAPFGRRIPPRVVTPSPASAAAASTPPPVVTSPVTASTSDTKVTNSTVVKHAKAASSGRASASPQKVAGATRPSLASATVPASPVTPATLEIEVDHKFAEARLSIWSDDHLAYTHLLEGTDKKHLGVFHHVQGHEIHAAQIPPGKHNLRVRVNSEAANYDQSATLDGDFQSGQESLLHIAFGKHGEINLTLQ